MYKITFGKLSFEAYPDGRFGNLDGSEEFAPSLEVENLLAAKEKALEIFNLNFPERKNEKECNLEDIFSYEHWNWVGSELVENFEKQANPELVKKWDWEPSFVSIDNKHTNLLILIMKQ